MKRINVMVENPARKVLGDWKTQQGFTTLDEALNALLLEFREGPDFPDVAQRKEDANHIDDLIRG